MLPKADDHNADHILCIFLNLKVTVFFKLVSFSYSLIDAPPSDPPEDRVAVSHITI